jgi:hypothetical protein
MTPPLPSRAAPHCRGLLLIEVAPALILVAAALTMASVLLGCAWALDRKAASEEAVDRTIEQAVKILRRDAHAAGEFQFVDDVLGVSFDGGAVVWSADANEVLARTERSEGTRSWNTGSASVIFEARPGGLAMLVLDRGHRQHDEIVVLPRLWAKEALR